MSELKNVILPEDKSIIKSIQCPTMAKTKYGKYKSVNFIFNKIIPEKFGYLLGYGFTGRGNNYDKSMTSRSGLTGNFDSRVLGSNYYLKTGTKCSNKSSSSCKNKDNYMYVRNVPILGKGLVGAMGEDMVDLNPVEMLQGLWNEGKYSNDCKLRNLPVGSAIDMKNKKFNNKKDYTKNIQKCLDTCKIKESNSVNCFKKCNSGWYLEKKCTADKKKYIYGGKEYFQNKNFTLQQYIYLFFSMINPVIFFILLLFVSAVIYLNLSK